MTKAYSYIRFSTLKQLRGDSLRRQTEASERYAAEHNLELDTSLNLRDLGMSAFDGSNKTKGSYGVFLRLVEEGKIPTGSYLLVESLDRISRENVLEAFTTFSSILRAGITIVTLMDNQVFSYESANDNISSLLISISTMYRANEESRVKSKRIRASWDNKRNTIKDKILTGRCPYWLTPSEDKRSFKFIDEKAEVVRRIYSMAKSGYGNSIIVKTLNKEKVPTFSNKTDGWQTSYIQKILSNPAVYGEITLRLQRDGESNIIQVISDYYPALMTHAEWSEINALRVNRTTQRGTNKGENISNLFSGLLKCRYCKGTMNMSANTKKKNGVIVSRKYVACSRARRGVGCRFIKWDYQDLENQLLTFSESVDFQNLLKTDDSLLEFEIQTMKQMEYDLKDKERGIKSRIENITNIIETGDLSEQPRVLLERLTKLESEITDVNLSLLEVSKKMIQLKVEEVIQNERLKKSVNIIEELKNKTGNELYDLRVQLSSRFKSAIKEIYLSPGGYWLSEQTVANMREFLDETEEGKERLNNFIKNDYIEPDTSKRSLFIVFNNGNYRAVFNGTSLDESSAYISDFTTPNFHLNKHDI